ncbi:reductive dehalogenase [Dehalococcoides mccartyi]|uniref:Reductive dehalogenase, putative n=1 Tax=Dehalococcoides mccartyi (strain ATCC BAA-2266 / KCTC 15142 / 195) TaxID=243164 RepID=Q3Z847_DEHM1|nr:reductive dehalogenase [Dehalococcoides mccartyi]AAW39843.1 reductive dehalogenase, putative [Dehalococcoides mccartyi 195]
MSNFHSTVSRRDFMKGLGLVGAGLGTATATAPLFKDLDDVSSSAWGNWKRPWWIKERELGNPTIEINWNEMQRFDLRENLWMPHALASYVGVDKVLQIFHEKGASQAEGLKNNKPGQSLRDLALASASSTFNTSYVPGQELKTWLGPQKTEFSGVSATPEELGVPKWEGTPEENLKMLRAAMRFFGASQIAVSALDTNERKIISTHDTGNAHNYNYLYSWPPPATDAKAFVFENVDKAYEGNDKYVLPDKPLWTVCIAVQMSKEMFRHEESHLRMAANSSRYRLHATIQYLTQNFLRGLGYQGMGYPKSYWGALPAQATAVLSGIAEMGRNDNYCISPEFGSVCGYFSLITDLPLMPTPPIDAGIFRFCHTCRKCAEACPVGGISFEAEPSWEIPPSAIATDKPISFSTPGKRTYHTDALKCRLYFDAQPSYCARCMGTCVFNTNTSAMVHELVKTTVSSTGLLNGFLWNADKAFGYGLVPAEETSKWWDLSLPLYGQDGSIGATDGGYK